MVKLIFVVKLWILKYINIVNIKMRNFECFYTRGNFNFIRIVNEKP